MLRGALLLCAVGLACGGEVAIAFRAEALQVSVRLPLADGRVQSEHRLNLVADLPRDRDVLRLAEPRFAPVRSDTGELLGFLVRPASRVQQVANDRQARRERLMRVGLDLTPPARTVRSLFDLRGSVQVTCGAGSPASVHVGLRPRSEGAVAVAGLAGATIKVEEVEERRVVLVISPDLAGRLAEIAFADAGGAPVFAKPPQSRVVDGGATRLQFEMEAGEPVSAAVAWYPELAVETVAVAIARLDIPGGIPGIGDATAPPTPPPAYKAPQLRQPLHAAIAAGDAAAVRRVLDADRDALERPEGDGRRPLHRAVVMGRNDIAEILLAAGADASARTREGAFDALALAAAGGDAASIAQLLAHRADPAAVIPGNGWSALHQAVNTGSALAVQVLLAQGADPWLQGKDGRSPLDLARDLGRWTLLRQMLGNPP